jgi:hypothetical protein
MSILKIRNSETRLWEPIRCVQADGVASSTVPAFVRKEAQRLAAVVQSHQNANTISFIACSDIHYYSADNKSSNSNADKMREAVVSMGQAMGLLRERVKIDFAAMFGDMIWDYGETRAELLEEMRFVNVCLHSGFEGIPQFRMEGNHDDAYESGGNLAEGEIFANIGAWNDGAVYGIRSGGYCYRDFEGARIRVICLNSSQYSGSAAQYSSEQVEWLATVLDLSNKGTEWRSIILSHHPLDWGRAGGVDPTPTITAATGVLASFHGHIHNFLTGKVSGTEIIRIGIPNAGYGRENQYAESYGVNWKEAVSYPKTPGTAENTSFCVVTIDLVAKKIYADHYGAGYDRVVAFDGVELRSYTVRSNVTHVTTSNMAQTVYEGASYSNYLTPDSGFTLKSVTVNMGGSDITASAVKGNVISINNVTGDIVITAVAEEMAQVEGNLVGTLLAVDGDDIFNTCCYLDDHYASGAGVGQDADCVVTGLLPYDYSGGVRTPVLISGCSLDTTNNHVRILGFNSEKKCYFQSAAGTELPTYFSIEVLGTNSYRVTPLPSIAQTNAEVKYLRFSLVGNGKDLVIVMDQ